MKAYHDSSAVVSVKWEPGNSLDRAIYAVQREFSDRISRVQAEEILRERAAEPKEYTAASERAYAWLRKMGVEIPVVTRWPTKEEQKNFYLTGEWPRYRPEPKEETN